MRRHTTKDQKGTGVPELLAAGVPLGPLAHPNRYYKATSGTKYHATSACNRLSSRRRFTVSHPATVSLIDTDETRFCVECVQGPTDPAAVRYTDHARRVLRATGLLAQVRQSVTDDQGHDGGHDGAQPTVPATADPSPTFTGLDTVHRTSWHRVTEAKAVRQLIASVCEDAAVHPDMATWAADTYRGAVELHEHLEQLAVAATDTGAVLRSCLVDLIGVLPTGAGPRKITAPVSDPFSYPALCTVSYSTRATGFKEKVNDAWLAWGDQVKLSGDLALARSDAMAAGDLSDLTPEHVTQLPTGPGRTPAPDSGSPWEWLVTEWRLAASDELAAIVTEWETSYDVARTEAAAEPDQVLGLREWNLSARTQVNASTELLSSLTIVADEAKECGLLVVPGAVARWLREFGTSGTRHGRTGYGHDTPRVDSYGDAGEVDTPATFATALRMWEPAQQGQRPGDPNPMRKLATVLDIARGIHTGAETPQLA